MATQCWCRFVLLFGIICLSLQNETELHIGTLIPLVKKDKHGFKTAIELAAETIRSRGILSGYKLVFHHKETYRQPSQAIQSLIEFRQAWNSSSGVKICILGPAVSEVATYTAQLATVWGTLQLSYGASNPDFATDNFPNFLSIVPTSNSINTAVIAFMNHFDWKRVVLAYDVNHKIFFLPTAKALKDKLETNDMNIVLDEGIDASANQKISFIQKLKEKDARIVIALFDSNDLIRIMCEAYNQGFYGDRIVWITYMHEMIFNPNETYGCNKTHFNTVSERMFVLKIQYYRTDMNKTLSGLTVTDFWKRMYAKKKFEWRASITMAFDTTWLLALSLNDSINDAVKMQEIRDIHNKKNNNSYRILTRKLRERMIAQDFEGISGRVKFNSNERLGTIVIWQRRKGKQHKIAQHHTFSNVLTFFPNQSLPEVLFKGTKYIQDGPRHINQSRHYSLGLFVIIWILGAVAMIVALALFYFNFKNREIRYIKMSSPHVNNIIIFGGLLCYMKVIFDTLDSRFLGLETYAGFCNARIWMMSLGFTTAFGAMFSKTWRVHRIFTASKHFRRAVIKNFHLYGLLFVLLVIDCMLLMVWMIVSPYQSGLLQLPEEEDTEEDTVVHPYIFTCKSKYENYFLFTTMGCKGLLLIFGIFLAWETRSIEIKALNDSKYIGISVYNVVILSVVGVILSIFLSGSEHYNVYLALMSLVVILCTAATLGIVFVPKIIGLQHIRRSSNGNEAMETTYSVKSSSDQPQCCCCETCKCQCSTQPDRKASIHVNNKFLAGNSTSNNSRKASRNASITSTNVAKPKVSVHVNARVSLSTYPISESPSPSPHESPRVGFLSSVNET